jgi:hypothetical protein
MSSGAQTETHREDIPAPSAPAQQVPQQQQSAAAAGPGDETTIEIPPELFDLGLDNIHDIKLVVPGLTDPLLVEITQADMFADIRAHLASKPALAHLTHYHFELDGALIPDNSEIFVVAPSIFVPLEVPEPVLAALTNARAAHYRASLALNAAANTPSAAALSARATAAMHALYDAEASVRLARARTVTVAFDLYDEDAILAHIQRFEAVLASPGAPRANYSPMDELASVRVALTNPASAAGTSTAHPGTPYVPGAPHSLAHSQSQTKAHGKSQGQGKKHANKPPAAAAANTDAAVAAAAAVEAGIVTIPEVPAYLRGRPFTFENPSGLTLSALDDLSVVALAPAAAAAAADSSASAAAAATGPIGAIAPAGTFTLPAAPVHARAAIAAPSAARYAAGDRSYWEVGFTAAAPAVYTVKVSLPAAAVGATATTAISAAASRSGHSSTNSGGSGGGAAGASVLCITASTYGFYVNSSTEATFDPTPARGARAASAHSLHALLCKVSPAYAAASSRLAALARHGNPLYHMSLPRAPRWQSAVAAPIGSVTTTGTGALTASSTTAALAIAAASPFAPAPVLGARPDAATTATAARSLGVSAALSRPAVAALGGVEAARAAAARVGLAGWSEELRMSFELPDETVSERALKERVVARMLSHFVIAATQGAVAITEGALPSLNESDPDELKIYLSNDIFYSSGVDGRGWLFSGGPEAVDELCNLEVTMFEAGASAGVAGVGFVASVLVSYQGRRILAQTTVPGIFESCTAVLSGSADNGEALPELETELAAAGPSAAATAPAARAALEALQRLLRVKGHRVYPAPAAPKDATHDTGASTAEETKNEEEEEKKASSEVFFSVETKVIRGSDKRLYVLDAARMLPRDVNFTPQDHPTALLRPELLRAYARARTFEEGVAKRQEAIVAPLEAARLARDAAVVAARDAWVAENAEAFAAVTAVVKAAEAGVSVTPEARAAAVAANAASGAAQQAAADAHAPALEAAARTAEMALRQLSAQAEQLFEDAAAAAADAGRLSFNPDAGLHASTEKDKTNAETTAKTTTDKATPAWTLAGPAEADTALLSAAAKWALTDAVPRFVEDAAAGTLCPLDGGDLTKKMHARGLSLRYARHILEGAEAELAASTGRGTAPAQPLVYLAALLRQTAAARAAARVLGSLLVGARAHARAAVQAAAAAATTGDAAAALDAAAAVETWTPAAVAARFLNALVGPASAYISETAATGKKTADASKETESAAADASSPAKVAPQDDLLALTERAIAAADRADAARSLAALAMRDPAAAADAEADAEAAAAAAAAAATAAAAAAGGCAEFDRYSPLAIWAAIRLSALRETGIATELPTPASWTPAAKLSFTRAVCLLAGIEVNAARLTKKALATPDTAEAAAAAVALFSVQDILGFYPVVRAPELPSALAAAYTAAAAQRRDADDADAALALLRYAHNAVSTNDGPASASLLPIYAQMTRAALAAPPSDRAPLDVALSSACNQLAIAQRRCGADSAEAFAAHADCALACALVSHPRTAALHTDKALLIAQTLSPQADLWPPQAAALLANKLILALPRAATAGDEIRQLLNLTLAVGSVAGAAPTMLQLQTIAGVAFLCLGDADSARALLSRVYTMLTRMATSYAAAGLAPLAERAGYWLSQAGRLAKAGSLPGSDAADAAEAAAEQQFKASEERHRAAAAEADARKTPNKAVLAKRSEQAAARAQARDEARTAHAEKKAAAHSAGTEAFLAELRRAVASPAFLAEEWVPVPEADSGAGAGAAGADLSRFADSERRGLLRGLRARAATAAAEKPEAAGEEDVEAEAEPAVAVGEGWRAEVATVIAAVVADYEQVRAEVTAEAEAEEAAYQAAVQQAQAKTDAEKAPEAEPKEEAAAAKAE